MNFTNVIGTAADEESTRLLTEVYLDKPFTGNGVNLSFIMKMLLNKQGSVGIEEALCKILKLDQNSSKHGFDARDPKTKILYELKPSIYPKATYNDVTLDKVDSLRSEKGNVVIFETHVEGKLKFIAKVSGKNISNMLEEKFLSKKKKIMKGDKIGSRQTHNISLLSFTKKYGAGAVEVLYYVPHKSNKTTGVGPGTIKILNLTKSVNKLGI